MDESNLIMELSDKVEEPHTEEPLYDFSIKEDVHILIYADDVANPHDGKWKGFDLEICEVDNHGNKKFGMSSYAQYECGCLDYMIKQDWIGDVEAGAYILKDVTGAYFHGDGWTTDDDMEIYIEEIVKV